MKYLGGLVLLALVLLVERGVMRKPQVVSHHWEFGDGDCVEEWPYHSNGDAA
jgi:hypothetical protein